MRILWFTNVHMPDVNSYFGKDSNVKGTGGWMGTLLELLKDTLHLWRKNINIQSYSGLR